MAVEDSTICELCIDHVGSSFCNECGLEVDQYGNTEADFKYCSFPDCGCDGSRLCMAKEGASEHACQGNIEGMWSSNSPEAKKAILSLVGFAAKDK
jgi:hypothetical protein